ncbi:MAG TPA: DinB family protein [Nocardioides sp.]|nr:DinB family protein [Nocardioides sp.]
MFERRDHDFTGQQLRNVVLRGADMRSGGIADCRLRGVDIWNVEISGDLDNVVINGVDVAPLVEAELDRRDPERPKMRPETPEGFREAWAILEDRWAATVERARTFPEERLHEPAGDEWSFIETLRHLCFASDAWVGRMVLGNPSPWHPLDLPWDEAPGWDGIPWDRDARPGLDEVLAVRRDRQAMVARAIDELTPERLASTVTMAEPGWPRLEDFPLERCLLIVLNEEYQHRQYAERDLTALDA